MSTQSPSETTHRAPVQATLRIFQALSALLLLALLSGTGFWWYKSRQAVPVTILVDGKPIATARDQSAARDLVSAAIAQKLGPGFPDGDAARLQQIQFQRRDGDTPIDSDETARERLAGILKLHVHAYAILIGGRLSIALPTSEAAARTLNLVKEHFAQMPPDAPTVGDPRFSEPVTIEKRGVDPARTRATAEEAAPYFWTPPPSRTVTVRPGDTGYAIAHRNHIAFSDFLAANSGRDMNRLTPGDLVNVEKMPVLVKVEVRKRITRDERILANVPEAVAGKRRVTYLVTYENGVEMGRVPEHMEMVEKAKTRSSL